MANFTSDHKKKLSRKLTEFQLKGLKQYAKYLEQQRVYARKAEIRKAYLNYIETQIEMNNSKIAKAEAKLR